MKGKQLARLNLLESGYTSRTERATIYFAIILKGYQNY